MIPAAEKQLISIHPFGVSLSPISNYAIIRKG
jgi:hypothetical protein